MLNQTGISKESAVTRKTILIAPELAFTLSCKIANTGVGADSDGKKIVKAGTPLSGNLEVRERAFTVASGSEATCVLLHDVDVTAGTANAQAVIFGFIDTSKLESSVVSALTQPIRASLTKITFVK